MSTGLIPFIVIMLIGGIMVALIHGKQQYDHSMDLARELYKIKKQK